MQGAWPYINLCRKEVLKCTTSQNMKIPYSPLITATTPISAPPPPENITRERYRSWAKVNNRMMGVILPDCLASEVGRAIEASDNPCHFCILYYYHISECKIKTRNKGLPSLEPGISRVIFTFCTTTYRAKLMKEIPGSTIPTKQFSSARLYCTTYYCSSSKLATAPGW